MGNKSNIKGAEGEREIVALFQKHGFKAQRGPRFTGPDIIHDMPNVHVEVKRVESLDIFKAMAQSKHDAIKYNKIPTVFTRADDQEWLVIVKADWFLEFMKEIMNALIE